jgi:hypothetical protein
MADNFDLKKFLKESKALENLNTIIGKNTNIHGINEGNMRDKIREMIIAELNSDEDLDEAKKKKDEEADVEVTDTETEDIPAEDAPIEDVPADETPVDGGGGIEDLAADMKGTEADLMDHLMKAFQIAKGMNNEKLETQVGNTLKFFVSEYIGGGEQ